MTSDGAIMNEAVRRRGRGRTVAALSIALCGAALLIGASVSVAPVAGATGSITVEQTPLPYDGDCQDTALARLNPSVFSYVTQDSGDAWKIAITNTVDLCTPIDATAVIYSMPKDGSQWPQTFATSKDLTIGDASVTTITFSKDCDPVQFDVVTGATPPVISPEGDHHGPLLFPADVGSSVQFPDTCRPTTSSTTTTASTTTTSSTTTTVQVAGVTTIQPGPSSTAVAQPVAVEGATQTSAASPSSLALTGAPSGDLAVFGGLLVLSGLGLLVWSRRNRALA